MTEPSLDLGRDRDLTGRALEPWVRRGLMLVFAAIAVTALSGAIGQRSTRHAVANGTAQLKVTGPTRVRGGLLFQEIVTVTARREIQHPQLVLNRSWFDGLQVNTIEPQATQETNTANGGVAFQFDRLQAGDTLRMWIDYQVDPTAFGTRTQVVSLEDGARSIATLKRDLTILP